MPVGIENLATGFLQGLNARKQQERQDVIDQREAERFDMQKQQFADQQAANQLSLKTNQFQLGQAQAKAEREKILQEKEDNFRKQWEGFARPFAMGNDQEGYNALEKTYNDLGYMGKGAFKRDAQGNVLLDDKGNITFLTYGADGKPTSKSLNKDKMIEGFINSYDPLKHWEHEQKIAEEIAKEDRKFKKELKLSGIKHSQALQLEGLRSRNQRALLELRGKLKDPKKYLSKPTQDSFYDVQEIIDPITKQKSYSKPIFNQDRYDDFMLFSHANNLDPDDNAYRLWRKSTRQVMQQPNGVTNSTNGLNAVQPQNSPVDLLRGKNIVTEQDAADVIRELRAKKFTDEQINAAFDELGL